MIRRSYLPLLFASLALGACAEDEIAPAAEEMAPSAVRVIDGPEQVMPGELIVKLRPGVRPQGVAALSGARFVERVGRGTPRSDQRHSVYERCRDGVLQLPRKWG